MRLTRSSSAPPCGLAAVVLLGCGPAVSLDEPTTADESSGTSTGAGPFGPLTAGEDGLTLDGLDDDSRLDWPSVKLDVAPDPPPPPDDSCPPDCQRQLDLVWSYDGFASVEPLAPQDRVLAIVEEVGSIVIAEERHGELELARVSPTGQELWTLPLALPCDPCRLVDLALLPSGDLLLAGHGFDRSGMPAALAVRVELSKPLVRWATSTPLAPGRDVAPRAGSLVVHDDLLFQPVLEAAPDDGFEQLRLFAYDLSGGSFLYGEQVAVGFASGDAPAPCAAYDTSGSLVATHPAWSALGDLTGAVRWLATPSADELAYDARVVPTLRLAATPDDRVLTLGQSPGDGQSLLYLDSGELSETAQWQFIHVLPTVTSTSPALAVDAFGHAHVVARTAQGRVDREEAVGLEVLRWSGDGELVWKVSLPLALDRVDDPVALALTPDGALVLAGFVAGARHVERRDPNCVCD